MMTMDSGELNYSKKLSHFSAMKLNFRVSYIFDEDTGESEILPGMAFVYYYRPIMILVEHDFCQSK